ncbi:hypothetical protein [Microcella sp.]|uniref:hypothetical protein n=1 Tax=Microcella sp. TaxID=1913979 RepID=UPI00256CE04A|nr:hypothetical protein [Microcella sp.]MBX9471053.1 hypothetical protein [Microcella sp.]
MTTNDHERQHEADPVADDIDERNPEAGDIVAGEQVLDEGKVSPNQDEVGDDHDESTSEGSTSHEREHAADERTDAGAAPIQPESS